MGLAAYKQIRFPTSAGTFGNATLVINRPTYESLSQPAADTLRLNDEGEYYPFIIDGSDFALSKKFTTTRGRRALDDLNVAVRDGLMYSGVVDGVDVSEDFTASLKTFFDVWFDETLPYKAFLLYHDNLTGNDEVTHIGWIDPLYAPSSDAYLFHALTGEQIWLGTRSLKMTAMGQAQLNLTWLDVLNNIGPSDCQEGTPYAGFMMAPTAFAGQKNTRFDLFSNEKGSLMQAVAFQQTYSTDNPIMHTVDAAIWPPNLWESVFLTGVVLEADVFPGGAGTGYVVGDEGVLDGGTVLATYKVTEVSGGGVTKFIITGSGAGYNITGANSTTATTGVGVNFFIDILKVGTGGRWGPSGLIFISIGTLFDKIALAMGVTAPTVVSAYRFWRQVFIGTSFPIKTDTPIDPADLWISLNVFAKSHPADGSYWDNPVGFSYGTPITEVVSSLCNMLVADFNVVNAVDGTQTLTLTPMGETAGTLPDEWTLIGTPQQEEPATGARVVQAKYRADELVIQAPLGVIGDASSVEIPARIHRWAKTSGSDTFPDTECITFDSAKEIYLQADECFKVQMRDPAGGLNAKLIIMPDCWKGLCYLYWFRAADTNPGVYPSSWHAFDNLLTNANGWANSFFVVNAVTRAKEADGSDFTPAANLQGEVNGNDYFNLRPYTAVAFASLTLPKPIVQVLTFAGVSDSTGSIQAIKSGLTKQWRFAGATQNWVAIQIDQLIKQGESTIKFQQYGNVNGFPGLTDLPYGAVGGTGGTSSTTGSATGGSDSGGSNPLALPFIREFPSEEAQQTITPRADIVTLIHTPYELGQTKDYVQYKNAAGTVIASVSAYGGFLSAPTANVIGFQVNQKEAEGIVAKARAGADGTWASIVVENNSGAYLSGIRENGKIFEGASSNTYLGITHDFSIAWRNVGVANGATTNDLTLGDYTNIRLVNSSGSGDTIITGMTSGSAGGKFLYIINETGYQITLPNDNAGSTAANRFYNGSAADSVVLQQKDTAFYIYDNTLNRWVLFSTTGTGGSSGGGLLYWTEAENTAAPNATVYATSFIPSGAATNIDAVFLPKGSGSILAAIPDNTAAGGDKRGEYSVDLQLGRTAAGEVVTGDYSFAVGFGNEVSDNYAAALGNTNIVSADSAVALGYLNTSSGIQSLTAGYNNIASESFTVAHGHSAVADKFGQASQASGIFTVQGDAQRGSYVLRGVTSDATSTEIFLNGTSLRITLVDYQTITFSVLITCRKAIGSGENAGYKIEGIINRDSGVGSVAFIGTPVVTILGETTGTMDATVTADTTNGALAVFVTGKASTGLQWVATVLTAEVIGAAAP